MRKLDRNQSLSDLYVTLQPQEFYSSCFISGVNKTCWTQFVSTLVKGSHLVLRWIMWVHYGSYQRT